MLDSLAMTCKSAPPIFALAKPRRSQVHGWARSFPTAWPDAPHRSARSGFSLWHLFAELAPMAEKKFELTNLATGKKSLADVKSGTLGPDVLSIGSLAKDHGLFTFDPGFMATASCESKITFIDGDEGVLLYRGYPIEQLAEKSNFLEVSYLLINGELPTNEQLNEFSHAVQYHTMINESLLRFFNGFQYNAHPMAMLSGVVASMAAFYHDSMDIHNPRHREIFAHRLIA